MILKTQNGEIHNIINFRDFQEILEPEIYDTLKTYINNVIDKAKDEQQYEDELEFEKLENEQEELQGTIYSYELLVEDSINSIDLLVDNIQDEEVDTLEDIIKELKTIRKNLYEN